jgi:hypothetical protein
MMSHLKQVLLETYGTFADKRIKKIESGKTFIADDRVFSARVRDAV